jgi:hypothetical protein
MDKGLISRIYKMLKKKTKTPKEQIIQLINE